MTNPNDDFHPLFNNAASPEFGCSSFGLDYNDDEFRAGYPFSDIPETALSESWESGDSSSSVNNDVDQLNNSSHDASISAEKEDEQVISSSSEVDEEIMDVQIEFNFTVKHGESIYMNSNQLNNASEEERHDEHQYNVDDDNGINVEMLKSLDQVETNVNQSCE